MFSICLLWRILPVTGQHGPGAGTTIRTPSLSAASPAGELAFVSPSVTLFSCQTGALRQLLNIHGSRHQLKGCQLTGSVLFGPTRMRSRDSKVDQWHQRRQLAGAVVHAHMSGTCLIQARGVISLPPSVASMPFDHCVSLGTWVVGTFL